MDKKEIKQEIKRLKEELKQVHPVVIVSDIEKIRHREQDVFEVDAVELVDERAKGEEND